MDTIKEFISPKNLLSGLVLASLLAFLWLLSDLTVKYFVYMKQKNYSIARVFEWGVIEMDEDNYVICADFRFHTDGTQEHTSQHLFESKAYRTEELAESAMEQMKAQDWKCYWFGNPKTPVASMQRLFPSKELAYALIALGVTLYFSRLKKRTLAQM